MNTTASPDHVNSAFVTVMAWIVALITITIGLGGVGLTIVGTVILRGWALSILWGWFMVPVFALPKLGIAQAIGIAMIFGLMTDKTPVKDREKDNKQNPKLFWKSAATNCGVIFLTLGIGWVVKQFM